MKIQELLMAIHRKDFNMEKELQVKKYLPMEEKKIINAKKELNMIMLQQSYLDALTYTDGVLQLLENSCQHSQLRSAYLGLRIHHVDRDGTDIQLFKTIRNRENLMNRYKNLSGFDWALEKNAKFYIEISVTDDSYISKSKRKGILETFCDNAMQRYPGDNLFLPDSLAEVFSDKVMSSSDDGIVHHYGIPALQQIILRNHGVFLVSSPSPKRSEIIKITQNGRESTTREELFRKLEMPIPTGKLPLDETSEYHILFPLGLAQSDFSTQAPDNWASIFETGNLQNISTSNVKTKVFHLHTDLNELIVDKPFLKQGEKIDHVREAVRMFSQRQKDISDIDNCIQLFDLRQVNGLQMELFAKFLFRIILKNCNTRPLYAVYFDDYLKQQEFIRLFSIFYARVTNRDSVEGNRLRGQIALCSTSADLDVPEVNLILNMQNWDSLLESARRFAYSNLESAQSVYSQIKYLSRNRLDHATGLPIFPFDLYLRESMSEKEQEPTLSTEDENCWFLRRISKLLQRDLQQERMGIKIQDVHAYLPSNVHLGSFYEAEQLFHNAEFVSRFAYLIARRLLRDSYVGKKYLIVCYEAYSALLGQYLADYLRASLGSGTHVEYAIMYQEKKGQSRLVMPPDTSNQSQRYQDYNFICLCPIGTTLSTIHTLPMMISKHFRQIRSQTNNPE